MIIDQYEESKRISRCEKYLDMGCLEQISLFEQLLKNENKHRVAIKEGEDVVSYSELIDCSLKYANLFVTKGINKGDTVLLQMPNSIILTEVCFGLWRIGAIPILAIPALRFAELKGIVEVVKPVAYFADEEYLGFEYKELAKSLMTISQNLKYVFFSNELKQKLPKMKTIDNEYEYPEYSDIAVLMLSSGTTGIPKLIPRCHAEVCLNALLAAERVQLNVESCYLEIVPVQHTFGFAQPGMLGVLFSGGKIIVCRVPSPDDILELIEQEKVTITSMVPSLALTVLDFLAWGEYDVSSINDILLGGSYVDDNLIQRIEQYFPDSLRIAYGFSEGTMSISAKNSMHFREGKYGGFSLSKYDEVRIVDEDGVDVDFGENGELIAKGPYTINAYYMNDRANETLFTNDGYYRTGDMARYTDDGNIQILGRTRELINRCGEKIVPVEVEEHLRMYNRIKDAVVVGMKDELMGQKICAFIITNDAGIFELRDLNQFFDELGVCSFKRPDKIIFVDDFPLTCMGKLDRIVLEKMVEL